MATFNAASGEIYYEVHGEQRAQAPLILLNGIMMSTKSWESFIEQLSKDRLLILMDFYDQGSSQKLCGKTYEHSLQIQAVLSLMKHLGHEKYELCGISYGAQIALQIAIKSPKSVDSLILFNASARTGHWLRDIGRAWNMAAKTMDAEFYYHVAFPYIYSNSFYNSHNEWMMDRKAFLLDFMDEAFLERMIRLTNSSENYDVLDRLGEVEAKTLIVSAEYDFITPKNESKLMAEGIKNSETRLLEDCGHASMYEKPKEFVELINGFLDPAVI